MNKNGRCPYYVYIRTFGCQMNSRDSEMISGMLAERGYEVTENIKEAGIALFNTCSVRQHAEDRVLGNVKALSARKKKDPDFKIGVLGCMSQRHGEALLKELPEVDLIVGPSNVYLIPELLEEVLSGRKVVAIDNTKRPIVAVEPGARKGAFSAFVNVMYGCDNYCSYCIVPYVRGREVSRAATDVVEEIRRLAGEGVKEVTLLGQNVNSYGAGLREKTTFPGLLEKLNAIDGIERIRFTTSHPKDAALDLFKAMRDLWKVLEHIHLPIQSGSDRILRLMNRGYTAREYFDKVNALRDLIPDAGISTDIIAGFPSESEDDHNATVSAMKRVKYNSAFIFKYSPRPPASSASLEDDVPEDIKRERNKELLDVQKKISAEINRGYVGTLQEVLVEGKSRMSDKEVAGRTRNNTSCVFPCEDGLVGKTVSVRIKAASDFTLKGEYHAG